MNSAASAPVRQPVPEVPEHDLPVAPVSEETPQTNHNSVAYLRLLWEHRRLLARGALYGLLASTLIAFLIPVRYESSARLMPPDNQAASGLASAAAAMSGVGAGLGGVASEFLGVKSTSDIFVGILSSRTLQDKLIQQFDLKKLYGVSRMEDARNNLAERTGIGVDRKSQIITITVTDHDPKRAAAMGQAYVEELNRLVAELSTSSARRERLFLEERLKAVNQDLEAAEKEFSQFSSKNTAIDIKEQGKAMVEAAATLQGQYIAAQSELEGVLGSTAAARLPLSINTQAAAAWRDLCGSLPPDESAGGSFRDSDQAVRTCKGPGSERDPDGRSVGHAEHSREEVAGAVGLVFCKTSWQATDVNDPRKIFAQEVFQTAKAYLPWASKNGWKQHSGTDEDLGKAVPQEDAQKSAETRAK